LLLYASSLGIRFVYALGMGVFMRFFMISFCAGFLFSLTFWGHLLPVRFPASELTSLATTQDASLETVQPEAETPALTQDVLDKTITETVADSATTTTPLAPTPRSLTAPKDSLYSMKDVEDAYGAFLANEQRLTAEMNVEQAQLEELLALRNTQQDPYAYLNPANPLGRAIRASQTRILQIKRERDSNAEFAYYNITLKFSAIQVGLSMESKKRTNELLNYVTMVRFQNDVDSSVYFSYPQSSTPLSLSEPYSQTTIDPLIYGPQLPQEKIPLRQSPDFNSSIQTSPYRALDPSRTSI
jgi:hypothetical protein